MFQGSPHDSCSVFKPGRARSDQPHHTGDGVVLVEHDHEDRCRLVGRKLGDMVGIADSVEPPEDVRLTVERRREQ
jgi:hypothetical protein